MRMYLHSALIAGLFVVGCQRPPATTATEGSSDRRAGTVEIPARTQLWVRVDKALDSAKAKQGDLVNGKLNSAVVAGGREVLPVGTDLGLRITNAQVAQAAGSVGLLTLDLETIHHGGAAYRAKVSPVTVETAPVEHDVEQGKQLPNLPLTERQGRANAVLDPDRPLLFETLEPVFIKP